MFTFTFISGLIWGAILLHATEVLRDRQPVPVIGPFDAPGLIGEDPR